ncbi:MAG: hypothetical protein AB7L76_25055, partial [Burkholderiaceae bacterium]
GAPAIGAPAIGAPAIGALTIGSPTVGAPVRHANMTAARDRRSGAAAVPAVPAGGASGMTFVGLKPESLRK